FLSATAPLREQDRFRQARFRIPYFRISTETIPAIPPQEIAHWILGSPSAVRKKTATAKTRAGTTNQIKSRKSSFSISATRSADPNRFGFAAFSSPTARGKSSSATCRRTKKGAPSSFLEVLALRRHTAMPSDSRNALSTSASDGWWYVRTVLK